MNTLLKSMAGKVAGASVISKAQLAAIAITAASAALTATSASALTANDLNFAPSPADLNDLDHHMVYTWRIDNVDLNGALVTAAELTFVNIRNWDSNPNILYMHLLDTAKKSGVASFVDDPTNTAPVTDLTDDFTSTRYHSDSNWLLAAGTSDTFLGSKSFTLNPQTYTYKHDASELAALNNYIANGKNFAIGLDPDCHFFNDGVKLKLTTQPVPEPGTFALLGMGLLGMMMRRRR